MSKKINCTQAYKAMLHFFDMISLETGDEEVAIFSSYGELYTAIPGECPQTIDASKWHDWMDGLKLILEDDSITYEFELTIEQGYAAAYQYIVIFCDLGAEPSVNKLRDLLDVHNEESVMKSWLYNHWLRSIEYILQEDPFKKYGLFFNEKTKVTERESFATMQIFLDEFCKKNNDADLILLIQSSRLKQQSDYWADLSNVIEPKILDAWQQSIEMMMQQEENKVLNLLNAYKVISLFLINYFDDKKSDVINQMILLLQDYKYEAPRKYPYWNSWIRAAGIANIKQMTICYDIISIYTPISQEVAFKIIQAWFAKYDKLVDLKFMATVLTDTILWQQAVDLIKEAPRSYLLLDNEVTILETYHIMLKLLELAGQNIDEFVIDPEQQNKPKDFEILLEWIMICEQIIKIY